MNNGAKTQDALSARIERLNGRGKKSEKPKKPQGKAGGKDAGKQQAGAERADALSARISKAEGGCWGRKLLISLSITAITVYLLFGVIFGIAYVKGESMTPAYKDGDLVLFLRIVPEYKAGNVVFIKTKEGEENIKRIVGCPNSTVNINGSVYIDNIKLKEKYIYEKTDAKDGVRYPLTLSDNEYFVLGDSRSSSKDSRNYGPVERKSIRGKALAVLRIKG